MADPNRDQDAARRDRTDPIARRGMSENESDLDSGPDTELDDDMDDDVDDDRNDGTGRPPKHNI
jgi:hypothetical protein